MQVFFRPYIFIYGILFSSSLLRNAKRRGHPLKAKQSNPQESCFSVIRCTFRSSTLQIINFILDKAGKLKHGAAVTAGDIKLIQHILQICVYIIFSYTYLH